MKRIITGWFLIMLMTVFTVTAQSGMRFCLCKNTVVVGDCPCDQRNYSPPTTSVPNGCGCKSCSNSHLKKPITTGCGHKLSISCSCMVDLSVQLNDFVINADDSFRPEYSVKTIELLLHEDQTFTAPSVILARGTYATRGSPASIHRPNVPIYIRDSVYRL